MLPKKKVKQKSGDQYARLAGDIRKQVLAMEKKTKKRPRMAAALSEEAEKPAARGFGTGKDARQPADREAATPATFGNLASRDAALAKAEARSPAGSATASPLGILSSAGHHLSPAELRTPDGYRSPAEYKSPTGSVVPMLSSNYVSTQSTPKGYYSVTPSPAMKARDRKKTWCPLVAAMVCVVLTVTAASAGVVMYAYRSADPTCKSAGCHLFSKAFQASMDTTVDPCQDFGRYVCGRYSHPRNLSVIEAAAQSYRDEVVAPARNASLIGTGQNALQKSWRFYNSCKDVLDNRTDNTVYVVDLLRDCDLSWPTLTPYRVKLVKTIVCLSTRMAWPSIVYFQVDSAGADVVRVTMNPSPYTKEIFQHDRGINATAYEAFFNAAVAHYRGAGGRSDVNFTTMHKLEMEYASRFGEEAGPLVFYDQRLPWVQSIATMLVQAMPDRVHGHSKLILATNYEHFVDWFVQRILNPQRDDELMLGWHVVLHVAAVTNRQLAILFHELIGGSKDPVRQHEQYCFDLTKKYMGLASIMYVSQQRFTDAVRSDVDGDGARRASNVLRHALADDVRLEEPQPGARVLRRGALRQYSA
ncbi:hypothetical protein MTO96_022913, partial [Rhipicephalus appendiculatus]